MFLFFPSAVWALSSYYFVNICTFTLWLALAAINLYMHGYCFEIHEWFRKTFFDEVYLVLIIYNLLTSVFKNDCYLQLWK